ncbi:MAG: AAA family ATPase [bacterium]
MYLKGIDITGFKSFAGRVRVEFKPGITGFIGPNGCGKSNVVDSIRWCIGEMSWKSLRSTSMVDIIFGGTSKRPPLHMAEVTMIFDNESRRLPVDFSEVSVSRKIFRSGESEYFMNKIQCRLRDIREMFLDTGIGGDGYAIIDQGGVNQVLESRPEQLRELFEEAAGVSKYKAKRDEALTKLEKVDMDLGRLADSITLIEDQIKKLDAEARKARLHQKYKEELEGAEVSMLLNDLASRKAEIETEEAAAAPVKRQMEDLNGRISAGEGESSALNLRLSEKQEEAGKLMETVSAVKYGIVHKEGTINNCERLAEEIGRQISALNADEQRNFKRIGGMDPEIENAQARLTSEQNSAGLIESELKQKASVLQSMETEVSSLQAAIETAESALNAINETEVNLSRKLALEESSVTHKKEDLINLEKELERGKNRCAELDAGLSRQKGLLEAKRAELEAAGAEFTAAENRKEEARKKLDELNLRLGRVREQKAGATARLEAVKAQGSRDSYWVGAQAVLGANLPGMKGTLRRAVEVRDHADRIIVEEAMGRFLDSIVCETQESAAEAINYLKHLGKGRCRFIVLNAVPEEQAAAWDSPKGAKGMLERIAFPPEYRALVSHLLRNVFASDGSVCGPFWVCGGVPEAASPESYWCEEGELNGQVAALEKEEAGLSSETASSVADASSAEESINAVREKLNFLRMEEHALSVAAAGAGEELGMAGESVRINGEDISGIREELEKMQTSLSGLRDEMGRIKEAREEKRTETETLRARKNLFNEDYLKGQGRTCIRAFQFGEHGA